MTRLVSTYFLVQVVPSLLRKEHDIGLIEKNGRRVRIDMQRKIVFENTAGLQEGTVAVYHYGQVSLVIEFFTHADKKQIRVG